MYLKIFSFLSITHCFLSADFRTSVYCLQLMLRQQVICVIVFVGMSKYDYLRLSLYFSTTHIINIQHNMTMDIRKYFYFESYSKTTQLR